MKSLQKSICSYIWIRTDQTFIDQINHILDLFSQKFEENRDVTPFEVIEILEELSGIWKR